MVQYWDEKRPLICDAEGCGFCEDPTRHTADEATELGWIVTGTRIVDQDFVTGLYCSEECLASTGKQFSEREFDG